MRSETYETIAPVDEDLAVLVRDALGGRRPRWPSDLPATAGARLVTAAAEHGIAPLLLHAIPDSSWPASVTDGLRRLACADAVAEIERAERVSRALEALTRRAVIPLLFKGTALAYTVYDAPDLRPRADTDLLIRPEDRSAAFEEFRALGYASSDAEAPVGFQATFESRSRSGIRHAFDVHWRLTNAEAFRDVLDYGAMLRRAVRVPKLSDDALAPSLVDALMIGVVHRVAHHYAADRLIWLYDFRRIADAMSDAEVEEFWRRALASGVLTVARDGIRKALEWFPEGRSVLIPEDEVHEESGSYLNPGRRQVHQVVSDLRASSGWKSKAAFLRRLMFPPGDVVRRSAGDARSPLPVLYLRRSVRGVRKLFWKLR